MSSWVEEDTNRLRPRDHNHDEPEPSPARQGRMETLGLNLNRRVPIVTGIAANSPCRRTQTDRNGGCNLRSI